MADRKGSILNYFQKSQPSRPSQSSASSQHKSTDAHHVGRDTNPDPPYPELNPVLSKRSQVVKSSDDEASESDGSLDEFPELFQNPPTSKEAESRLVPSSNSSDNNGRPKCTRGRNASPPPPRRKYKFDLATLAEEARIYDESEAKLRQMREIMAGSRQEGRSSDKDQQAKPDLLLQIAINDDEGDGTGKVMRALQRTEATRRDTCFYFFVPMNEMATRSPRPFPVAYDEGSWADGLADPQLRPKVVLSGIGEELVKMGETLPDPVFLWMLYEFCCESRSDLTCHYGRILLASYKQLSILIEAAVIIRIFDLIGGSANAIDTDASLNRLAQDTQFYHDRDWTSLKRVVFFLGEAARNLSPGTQGAVLRVLLRLCADSVVIENMDVLDSVQTAMCAVCSVMSTEIWADLNHALCDAVCAMHEDSWSCLQILQCIPPREPRLHDLRRRIALAVWFNDDEQYSTNACHTVRLSRMGLVLEKEAFAINEDTDYRELSALISLLDIAIDDGVESEIDLSIVENERRFNANVDILAARIKILWGSIHDSGASFISRIDAKQVMEGVRHRLMYGVRTKPIPKRSIFDEVPDNSIEVKKQSAMMNRHFRKQEKDTRGVR